MRRLRLRIRLRRPELPGGGQKDAAPAADELPSRAFPPVPDGKAVPRPPTPPGELPPRPGPRPQVNPAIARPGGPEMEDVDEIADGKGVTSIPYQPVLPSLGVKAPPRRETPAEKAPSPGAVACVCPVCGHGFSARPHMKSPCGSCHAVIHVRAGQRLFTNGLVPDSEVDAVDLMERLDPLGITEEKCARRLERDEAGRPRPGALAALLRNLCEERLPELLPGTQVRLLHEMARERQYRSEDPRPLLRRAQVILLQKMRDAGVDRVRIACRGSDACPACREQTGRSISIAEALEQQVLPLADCRQAGGFCRCRYTEADGAPGPTLEPMAR